MLGCSVVQKGLEESCLKCATLGHVHSYAILEGLIIPLDTPIDLWVIDSCTDVLDPPVTQEGR